MEKFVLDSKGICHIIKTCSKANVREFKFGDLTINFHSESGSMSTIIETTNGLSQLASENQQQLELWHHELNDMTKHITSPEQWFQDSISEDTQDDRDNTPTA